jgi:hypothetical protein
MRVPPTWQHMTVALGVPSRAVHNPAYPSAFYAQPGIHDVACNVTLCLLARAVPGNQ